MYLGQIKEKKEEQTPIILIIMLLGLLVVAIFSVASESKKPECTPKKAVGRIVEILNQTDVWGNHLTDGYVEIITDEDKGKRMYFREQNGQLKVGNTIIDRYGCERKEINFIHTY